MSLPIVTLKSEERWDCHQCGVCCRGSLVALSRADLDRLDAQKWHEDPEYRNTRITVVNNSTTRPRRLAQRSDGCCVFLADNGLCKIHMRFGFTEKPTYCQAFPMQLVVHERQAIVTVRRACPSAAAERGRLAADHLPTVRRLISEGRLQAESSAPPMLKAGETRDWKTMRAVLDAAGGLLLDQRFPPVRRLVHTLQFASLLDKAKTEKLEDHQVIELARTLADLAPEESKPLFENRVSPKGYSKIIFRLMAIETARLHPRCRLQANWTTRGKMVVAAWKALRGSGNTPDIDQVYPRVPLPDLEKPTGPLPPEVYLPLSRFLESNAESYLYAIADRRGWPLIESLRGLALRFPVGLWLLKWIAAGRQPTVEDMANVVVALDRSQGYGLHTGARQRGRLNLLATNEELERLVIWYAR